MDKLIKIFTQAIVILLIPFLYSCSLFIKEPNLSNLKLMNSFMSKMLKQPKKLLMTVHTSINLVGGLKRTFLLMGILLFLCGCGSERNETTMPAGQVEEQQELETSLCTTCEFGDLKCLIGFEFGDPIDVNLVWTQGRYLSGGMIYYLKSDSLKRFKLFFEGPGQTLSSIQATNCNFFGIELSKAKIADIEVILGQPQTYEKNDSDPYGGGEFSIPGGYWAFYSLDENTLLNIEFDKDQVAQMVFYKRY